MNALGRGLVIAAMFAGLTGCFEEDKPFRCAAWCAADASDVVYRTYYAEDVSGAQSQCFADWDCSDMPGRILKCVCEAE